MLACVCADAGARLRLLRAIADGLAVSCSALEAAAAGGQVHEGTENNSMPHDRAIW